jgi:hypothetical protein
LLIEYLCGVYRVAARGNPRRPSSGQATDQQDRGLRKAFPIIVFPDSDHIADILYESILKAASSDEKRPALLSGDADTGNRSAHVSA